VLVWSGVHGTRSGKHSEQRHEPASTVLCCAHTLQELERELSKYRMQEAEATKKKASSGSLWSYMAGSS
jgi:hypothetical protein